MSLLARTRRHFEFRAARRRVSDQFLAGEGIEIGALQRALPVGSKSRVRYVDYQTTAQLRKRYPELKWRRIANVEAVDDGEVLSSLAPASLDFVIANHMLEHCQNPLGTIRNHSSKLKIGGVLYYAIPEKTQTFDSERPVTPFEHLVRDDKEGPEWSREQHYWEWATLVNKFSGEKAAKWVQEMVATNYSIHFHVWDRQALFDFFTRAQTYLGGFHAEHFEQNQNEIIVVLRRNLESVVSACAGDSGKFA
ncbi:MAG: class I SAM-dependent methyltransferase [Acidobacteriota bacterium]|nr:class I SAM-dependent methyltransferase [Acidobacteriota bacterium]